MRFAVKSTVALSGLYLLIVGGLVVWVDYELRSVAASLMEDTARLVGNEVAAATTESAREQLLLGDPATRLRLVQIVADLTQRSDVVASVTVVDEAGRVVISDEIEIGQQLALPAVIFQDTRRPQLLSALSPFQGGTYHLFVPLLRQDIAVGYIRLSLSGRHIASLYRRAHRRIALVALTGLTCLGTLGVFFHLQLSRRDAALLRALEATARGEAVPAHVSRDEFSQVIEAAGRLGRELNETRERSSQAQRRISALASFMDVGVLLLGRDQRLEFANAAARELFGCSAPGDLEQRWDGLKHLLAQIEPSGQSRTAGRGDIELPAKGRSRGLRLELHRPGDEEHGGWVVLVKDRELFEAFETDLRLATQMRGLARIYGALAHELKAPLGAMALNLELLNDALSTDGGSDPDVRERRKRYAEILREELARLNRSLVSVLNQTTAVSEAREHFDFCALVRDLGALLAPQAKQQHVELEVQLPEGNVPLVGHRDRLKQALLNIATNALEAMPDGGRMGVTLDAQDGRTTVSIRDSGPGIPPDLLEKIYGMYFTSKTGGTGIGLYVARSIVESHGGGIEVESRRGQGTCFKVNLPLDHEAA